MKYSFIHRNKTIAVFLMLVVLFCQYALCSSVQDQFRLAEKYLYDDKPQSAAEVLESILANKKAKPIELLESAVKLSSVYKEYKENSDVVILDLFRNLENKLRGQYLAVDYALIANFYSNYLNHSLSSRFAKDAATLEEPGSDFTKWSRQTLQDTIWYYQLKSVESAPGLCQKTDVNVFEKLLRDFPVVVSDSWYDDGQKNEKIDLVTNLQQMLICNAIEHEVNRSWIDNLFGTGAKMLYDKRVCSTANDFINLCTEYNSRSVSSGTLYMLYLLTSQAVGMSADMRAAIDLYRINKLSSIQQSPNYTEGLKQLAEYYNGQSEPLSTVFYYMLAKQYSESNPERADSICDVAVDLFPRSIGAEMCSALKDLIRKPAIQADFSKVLYAESENIGYVVVNNVERVYFTLIPIQYNTFIKYTESNDINSLKNIRKDNNTGIDWEKAVVWEQKVADKPSFEKKKLYFSIPETDDKDYILIIADKPGYDTESTAVICNLSCEKYVGMMQNNNVDGNVAVGVVADMNTGKPASGQKYSFYSADYSSTLRKYVIRDLYASGFVNGNGFVQIDNSAENLKNGHFVFSFDDGSFSLNYYHFVNITDNEYDYCYIYTDRKTYRPGDTVQVYALLENIDKMGQSQLAVGKNLTLDLYDQSHKVIQTFEGKTDEYGACVTGFVLPDDLRVGNVTIQASGRRRSIGSVSVNVIEYVQPKLDVTLSVKQPYCVFGKTVTVTGSAESFSGVPVQGSVVKYYVDCSARRLYYNQSNDKHVVKTGKTVVDSDGLFDIEFKPELPDNPLNVNEMVYDIHATVVASDGNSVEQNMTVIVSEKPFRIEADGFTDKGSIMLHCNVMNAQGKVFSDVYNYQLYKLKDQAPKYAVPSAAYYSDSNVEVCLENIDELEKKFPNYAFQNENDFNLWAEDSLICSGTAMSDMYVAAAKNLENGVYRLIVTYSKDGKTVTDKTNFVSVAPNSAKAVGNSLFTAILDKTEYKPGETALLTVQSPYEDVTVYCLYENAGGVIKADTIELSKSVRTVKVPVTINDCGGISISMMAVKDKVVMNKPLEIVVVKDIMNLVIDKFDDKMESGSNNRLTLHVTDGYGKPSKARIVLSMNDASLYSYGQNYWNIPFEHYYTKSYARLEIDPYKHKWYLEQESKSAGSVTLKARALKSYLDYNLLDLDYNYMSEQKGLIGLMLSSNSNNYGSRLQGNANMLKSVGFAADEEQYFADEAYLEDLSVNSSVVRSNFGNTALFKVLDTDKYGSLSVPFKSPDLLTEWNLQVLAYNKKLESDFESKRAKTYRTVMIEALPLQFVTQGDTVLFTARVSNTSDHDADAQVYLKLEDGKGNLLKSALPEGAIKEVTVPAMGTSSVSFTVAVPHDIENLDYTFVVSSAWSADGERNVLPVRSNVITLTESAAFYNNGNETRSFPVNFKYSAPRKVNSLKLEVTPNAVWCALRALSGLKDKDAVTNYSNFCNLYADMMYYSIFKDYPDIQKEVDADSVQLLAAKSGIRRNFDKLSDAVEDDGGWSWISGYTSDFYISLQILKGFADMHRFGVLDNSLDILTKDELYSLIEKSVNYLDTKMFDRYTKELKNKNERSSIGYTEILYLYTRTLWTSMFEIDKKYSKMFDFYQNVALKQKRNSLSLRERALLSLTLSWQGSPKAARKYAEGLVERSLVEDEFGMFWRDNTDGSEIELQALIIQALSNAGYVNESELATRWLIKQKQATAWDNAHETAYAIAALLDNGAISVPADDSKVAVSFDGADIDPIVILGKTDFTKELNVQEATHIKNISVQTNTDNMCWGALYCEYSDKIDNVESFGQGVSIIRSYYIVNDTESGTSLTKVSDINQIGIGQKVLVRLTVTSDRAADYVEIKDMHAAGFIVSDQRARRAVTGGKDYYIAPGKDNCRIYISRVSRGEQIIEYNLTKVADGQFTIGPATMECTIAPEFRANTDGSIK